MHQSDTDPTQRDPAGFREVSRASKGRVSFSKDERDCARCRHSPCSIHFPPAHSADLYGEFVSLETEFRHGLEHVVAAFLPRLPGEYPPFLSPSILRSSQVRNRAIPKRDEREMKEHWEIRRRIESDTMNVCFSELSAIDREVSVRTLADAFSADAQSAFLTVRFHNSFNYTWPRSYALYLKFLEIIC